MKILNIINSNITVGGSLYCSGDIHTYSNHLFDLTQEIITYNINIGKNLYFVCNHIWLVDCDITCNCTITPNDNNESLVFYADHIYISCPNLNVGGNVMTYHMPKEAFRTLKLNKIRNNVYNRQKNKTMYMQLY